MISIKVVQDDIDQDVENISVVTADILGSCTHPITKAIIRSTALEHLYMDFSDDEEYPYNVRDRWNIFELPKEAQRWCNKYDEGEPIQPFEFTLDVDETELTYGEA